MTWWSNGVKKSTFLKYLLNYKLIKTDGSHSYPDSLGEK